jgi:hypothetical protein
MKRVIFICFSTLLSVVVASVPIQASYKPPDNGGPDDTGDAGTHFAPAVNLDWYRCQVDSQFISGYC